MQSAAVNHAASLSAMVSQLLHQSAFAVQELIEVGVVDREHAFAFASAGWKWIDSLRRVLKRTKSFFLNSHCEN